MADQVAASGLPGAGGNVRPALTRQQRQMVAILRDAGGWLSGRALRDALGTSASSKSVHVQIWKIRKALGSAIELQSGHSIAQPGYLLIRCDEGVA